MDGKLQDYGEVVGQETIDEMRTLAGRLEGKRLQHINATAVGGLVAEILTRMVPVMRELGVETSWDIIKGDRSFYNVAQTFNKALYGSPVEITEEMFEIFRATNEMNCREMQIKGDVVVVHDPQPIGLIDRKRDAGGKWLWAVPCRCIGAESACLELPAGLCRGVRRNRLFDAGFCTAGKCPSIHDSAVY